MRVSTTYLRYTLYALLLFAGYARAVPVAPATIPHITFVNQIGLPCAGCKLYSYAAGTTTQQPTYTDSGGVTQNTNPITLDTAGGANIWLGANAYKFILKDALGATIWTVDNVPSLLTLSALCPTCVQLNPTGNQTITQPSGTTLSVSSLNGVINAALQSGSTIAEQINSAFTSSPCATVFVPQGTYTTSVTIRKPTCGNLLGAGSPTNSTVIVSSANPALLIASPTSANVSTGTVRDIQLKASGSGQIGMYVGGDPASVISPSAYDGSSQEFDNLYITGFANNMQGGNNFFLEKFHGGGLYAATVNNFNCPAGLTNSGEQVSFSQSSISNSAGTGVYSLGCEVNLSQTSIDYNTLGIYGIATCYQCHIEQTNTPAVTVQEIFSMQGGVILTHGIGSDSAFVNSSSINPNVQLNNVSFYSSGPTRPDYCFKDTATTIGLSVSINHPVTSTSFCLNLTNLPPNNFGVTLFDPDNTRTDSTGIPKIFYNSTFMYDRNAANPYTTFVDTTGIETHFKQSGTGTYSWRGTSLYPAAGTATSSLNYGSGNIQFADSTWNGTAPVSGGFFINETVPGGTNQRATLNFNYSGSSGGGQVQFPNILDLGLTPGQCVATDANKVLVSTGAVCGGGGSSPLTTKGDLYGYSTTNARVPVGTNGQVLTADSTNANGVSWAAGPAAVVNADTCTANTTYYKCIGISPYTIVSGDISVALQQAVTDLTAVGGGTIRLPNTSVSLNGALQDPTGANGVVIMPSILSYSAPPIVIDIEGSPALQPANPTSIGSTITTTNTTGNLISGYYGGAGTYSPFTNVWLNVNNVHFRLPTNSGVTAVNARYILQLNSHHILCDTPSTVVPSNTASACERFPALSNQIGIEGEDLTAVALYTGFVFGEHAHILSANGSALHDCFVFDVGTNSTIGTNMSNGVAANRLWCGSSVNGISSGTYATTINVQMLELESITGRGINDSSSLLSGSVTYKVAFNSGSVTQTDAQIVAGNLTTVNAIIPPSKLVDVNNRGGLALQFNGGTDWSLLHGSGLASAVITHGFASGFGTKFYNPSGPSAVVYATGGTGTSDYAIQSVAGTNAGFPDWIQMAFIPSTATALGAPYTPASGILRCDTGCTGRMFLDNAATGAGGIIDFGTQDVVRMTVAAAAVTATVPVTAPSYTANGTTNGQLVLSGAPSSAGAAAATNTVVMEAPSAPTAYKFILPNAQPTSGNNLLSCTAANPAVCTWVAGSGAPGYLTGSETVASSTTPIFSNALNTSYMVLTGTVTTFTLPLGVDGQHKTLCYAQNGTGNFAVNPPANVKGHMTVSLAANSRSCQEFVANTTLSLWLATTPGVVGQ